MTEDERLAQALELLDSVWHSEPGVYVRIHAFLSSFEGWEPRIGASRARPPAASPPVGVGGRFFINRYRK